VKSLLINVGSMKLSSMSTEKQEKFHCRTIDIPTEVTSKNKVLHKSVDLPRQLIS
jgi:hypothetical protein